VELGHRVTIVSSSFFHTARRETRLQAGEMHRREVIDGIDYLWLRAPAYGGNSLGRLWNMLTFAWRVWRQCGATDIQPPDVVIGSSPQLFAAWSAERLARQHGVPFVLEIRDLWPESFVSLGHMTKWHPLVFALGFVERLLYRRASRILSLLPNGVDYIEQHGGIADKIEWLPNGIDFSLVPPSATAPLNDQFTLVFAGSHGAANGLDQLLDAAKLLQSRDAGDCIRIQLVGDGPEKPRLQQRVIVEGIRNVDFLPPVPKQQVYNVFAAADACLMLLEDSPVFRWGISPNKLFDYMASSRPVVFSVSTNFNPISQAKAGITVRPGDVDALADGIEQLANTPLAERQAMGIRGREYVERHHDFRALGDKLERVLVGAIEVSRHCATSSKTYVNLVKPVADRVAAALGLLVAAPLLLVIALLVRINCGAPILLRQTRPGRNGRIFQVYKFRTMTNRRDEQGNLLPDDKRLTRFGRWLRSTSLDELPELWNVIRGDMSLVGPRPLLVEYLDRYTPEQARRHDVKPGLTGLAQVCGRNFLSWAEKFDADLEYVDNVSLTLDLKILWQTIGSVFSRQGISAPSHATMPLFTGLENDDHHARPLSA
jgi:lipopolysaccharide/colanic/teichoic acid biosynthesis glycosyltransferase/glycosyltransferase involved in cell wall biosynthesis